MLILVVTSIYIMILDDPIHSRVPQAEKNTQNDHKIQALLTD